MFKNIIDNYDKIIELPERKRMKYIRDYCVPNDVSASYNTIKAIWIKIYKDHTSATFQDNIESGSVETDGSI